MKIQELGIQGCLLIEYPHFTDERGSFVKTFNKDAFKSTPLENFQMEEEFYSSSKNAVVRGLHFQTPPSAHDKLVYCIDGLVLDFFCDLRKDSDTFGKHLTVELSSKKPSALYLPKGIAHGFLTLSDTATLVYKTNKVYVPEDDKGILWSSIGLSLPVKDPVVSERDQTFPELANFESPF